MKPKFIIPALIVLVVIALLVYFFRNREKYTSEVVLTCTFTTPITYGYQSSFSNVVAYIIDCGTDVATCTQPTTVTDDQLSNQSFIKLTDLTTIEIDDTNKANLLLPSTSVTLKIRNTGTKSYTVGNTYAVGIAIKNKDNLVGDFIYGTAKLDSSDVPVTYLSYGKKTACRGSDPDGLFNKKDFTTDSPLLNLKLSECKDKCTKTQKCKGVSFVSDPTGIDLPGQCFIFTGGEFAPYGLAGADNEECWYASTAKKGPTLNLQKNPGPIKDLTVAFHSTVTPPAPGPPSIVNPYNVTPVTDKKNEIKISPSDFSFFDPTLVVHKVDDVTVTTGEYDNINVNIKGATAAIKCYQITGTFYTPSDGDFSIGLSGIGIACNPTAVPSYTLPGNNIKTTIILNIMLEITLVPGIISLKFSKNNIYISDIRINPITTLPCTTCSK